MQHFEVESEEAVTPLQASSAKNSKLASYCDRRAILIAVTISLFVLGCAIGVVVYLLHNESDDSELVLQRVFSYSGGCSFRGSEIEYACRCSKNTNTEDGVLTYSFEDISGTRAQEKCREFQSKQAEWSKKDTKKQNLEDKLVAANYTNITCDGVMMRNELKFAGKRCGYWENVFSDVQISICYGS